MLTTVESYLQHLITQVAVLINPISAILRLVGITTKEHVPYFVENEVNAIGENLNNVTYGLPVIAAAISALQTSVNSLGSPQQSTSPVILPTVPPTGYGTPTDQEIADACWLQPPTGYPSGMDYPQMQTVQSVGFMSFFNVFSGYGIFVIGHINWDAHATTVPSTSFAQFDPTDILPGETLLANLTRQNPTWIVGYGWPPQTQVQLSPTDGTFTTWITSIDESDWPRYYDAIYPSAGSGGAPVWPGLDLVTLGAVTALSDGLVVAGPLSGCIVAITSVPSPISYYPFGSIRSFVRAGALVFTDDNGDSEFPQPFGPENQVILPISMSRAESLTVRLASGIVGTIQPFTIP